MGRSRESRLIVVMLVVGSASALAQPSALDVKASGKKSFYVNPRAGNSQVSIFSQSTLEDFTTVCNRVSGQCELDPKNLESFTGRFALLVKDLRTGIELRDKDLLEPAWFDAAKYPEIVVEITKVSDVKKTDAGSATMKLGGRCTLHGKTNPVSIPATLTYLDESPTTMKIVKGDVLRIRAEFDVKLSDYGITGPPESGTIGLKVSDTQAIKVTVFAATERPPEGLQKDTEATSAPAVKPPPGRKP